MKKQTVILIPAYNPDDKFISFLNQLKENGFNKIIVVNDGSRKETDHYFEQAKKDYHCDVVTHEKNKGYGTRAHYQGIEEMGITPIHRRSFLKKYTGQALNR